MQRICLVSVFALCAWAQQREGAEIYKRSCAVCHDQTNIERIPKKESIAGMSPETVLAALTTGVMRQQGAPLSVAERRTVSEYLTGKRFGGEATIAPKAALCKGSSFSIPAAASPWNGWGVDAGNTRYQPKPGFAAADVPRLKLKWAYGFAGLAAMNMQPVVVGGRVFIGGRTVVALDAASGCTIWEFQPEAAVRAAISIAKPDGSNRWLAFVGDGQTNVYALDAATGELVWKTRTDDAPVSKITGAPKYHANRLYVPISSLEDGPAMNPKYECCKYSGAVAALDALSGRILWKTATITEPARVIGQAKDGRNLMGPSGASVWSSPSVDPNHNVIYFGTGNNHSNPPTSTSDSVIACDMETGGMLWVSQMTRGGDAWNMGCVARNENCPTDPGPDHDVGNSPILVSLKDGRRALVFGQKSGQIHAIDPDQRGRLLWTHRIGEGSPLGGIEWGGTSDGVNYYVPLSDVGMSPVGLNPQRGGGLFAFDIATGKQVWRAAPSPCPKDRRNCSPAQSQAATSMPGVVFSGAVDGILRAFSTSDGSVQWEFDTLRDFTTVNGVKARGGALDAAGPAIAEGLLLVGSGHGNWGGAPGNVLLAFSVDGR